MPRSQIVSVSGKTHNLPHIARVLRLIAASAKTQTLTLTDTAPILL